MRTTALKLSRLWQLRGTTAVLERLHRQYISRVYRVRIDNVYAFHGLTKPPRRLEGYRLEYREVPQDDPLEWHGELHFDREVDADRFRQGARRYAVIWDDKGIDLCWAFSGGRFHDCLDGFTMQLGPKQVYFFDYRGIQKDRPRAFSGFGLWSNMAEETFATENARLGGGVEFLSLVDQRNRVSNAFHVRKLGAECIGQLRTRLLFGRPKPLITAGTPDLFVRPG